MPPAIPPPDWRAPSGADLARPASADGSAPEPSDVPPAAGDGRPAGRVSRRWRLDPGRPGVRALAAAVAVVAAIAAGVAWWSRPTPEPVRARPAGSVGQQPSASPSALLVVALSGRVRRPGLVRLPAGARVADAIAAAGGALPGTDLGYLNLARKVGDGELIVVGGVPAGGAPSAGAAGQKVDLNVATAADLDALPGVGPVTAQRIVDYRTQHGPFHSIDELRQIDGIGAAKFEQLKDLVTV